MNGNWLTQLAPAHAPAAVGWWPPAPGWWVVGLLCVLAVTGAVLRLRDRRRALRRAALRQLRIIRASDADGAAVARATLNLIRRYALEVFGRDRVARLTGEAWLSFVMDAGGDALAGAPGRSMLAAAFGNTSADERDQWFAGAEGFINRAGKRRQPVSVDQAARLAHAPRSWVARTLARSGARAPSATAAQAPGAGTAQAPGATGARASRTEGTRRAGDGS